MIDFLTPPSKLFQLDKCKYDLGKPYNRITLYLVERELLTEEKETNSDCDITDVQRSCCQLSEPSTSKPECSSLENDQGESLCTSIKTTQIVTLRETIPDKTEDELKAALDASSSLEEAVNLLVVSYTDQSVNDIYESLIAHDIESSVNDDCIYDNEHPCDEGSTATETFLSSTDL